MKKFLLLVLLAGLAGGAFFAFRWFRGDTAYEDAVQDLEDEAVASGAPA